MESALKPSRRKFGTLALAVLGLSNLVSAGNTTCAGNLTDWYTNAVGETACETYQRLRQICNPQYQVPNFRPNTPGDQCDDQLADCCCNSISFALSMLCMNCQWDVLGGSTIGIDAGKGAYGMYRAPTGAYCSPGTNQSLPNDIQTAVCNENLKLDNFLYELFWNAGDWYFVYTMDTASRDQATNNNNTFTHCNSTTLTTTSLAPSGTILTSHVSPSPTTPTTSSTTSASSSHVNTAAVAGGVVGGVGGVALVLAAGFLCWKKRRQDHGRTSAIASFTNPATPFTAPTTPFTQGHSVQYSSGSMLQTGSNPAYTNLSSSVGPASEAGFSRNSSDIGRLLANEPIREDDMGPVPPLGRSLSGRLPPAYDPEWDQSQSQSQFQFQSQSQSQPESPPQPQRRPLPQIEGAMPPVENLLDLSRNKQGF